MPGLIPGLANQFLPDQYKPKNVIGGIIDSGKDKTKKFLMDFVKGNVGRIPVADATGEVQQAAESPEAANMGLFGINPNQYSYFK